MLLIKNENEAALNRRMRKTSILKTDASVMYVFTIILHYFTFRTSENSPRLLCLSFTSEVNTKLTNLDLRGKN